jgi:hypothetical protein
MERMKIKITYEKISKKKYWITWTIIGVSGFLLGEIILRLFEEKRYLITQLFFPAIIIIFPIAITYIKDEFIKLTFSLKDVFWECEEQYEKWINKKVKNIFSLERWPAIIATTLLVIFEILSIIYLGLPFNHNIVNWIALISLSLPLTFCSHSAYLFFLLTFSLIELANRDGKIPFLLLSFPPIRNIQSFYSRVTIMVIAAYGFLLIMIWTSPYSFVLMTQVWLGILALYPVGFLICTFIYSHKIMVKIKDDQTQQVNNLIKSVTNNIESSVSIRNLLKINKLLELQNKVQKMKEWPINMEFSLTFFATLLTAIIQIIITYAQFADEINLPW